MAMRFLTILAALTVPTFAHAEPPPGTYDRLRANAEEAVTIQVTSAKASAGENAKEVIVEAKVLGVERTKSGLKKGDSVIITYSVPTVLKPGPTLVPILDKEGVYPAFLNKQGKVFSPAAAGSSFQMTPEPAETDREAQRVGRAVLKVEEFLKAQTTDAEKLKKDVVSIGHDVDMESWVRARLADEVRSLQAWVRDTRPVGEKEKELKTKIKLLEQTIVEIIAPK